MGMHTYIGARYVPKFLGTHDPTQVYEALDVVDNGYGTSYIAKIPTPAGTPLTDTDHWFIYGAASGAIINLQNQIDALRDDMKEIIVTPEMFGAVGDGVTDDTQAVRDALDFGGNIYVENTYLITDMIKYTKPVNVFGNGEFIVTSGYPLFFVDSGVSIKGITFEGFTITGDGVTPTATPAPDNTLMGVIGNYSGANLEDYHIRNVKFKNVSFGIYLDANNDDGIVRNVSVENCQFKNIFGSGTGTGNAIAIANNHAEDGDIAIKNNYIDNCGRHAIYCSYAKGVVISGNTILNHGLLNGVSIDNNAAINIARSENIIVEDNFISKCWNISINVTSIDGNESHNITVKNNCITDKAGNVVDLNVGADTPDSNGLVRNIQIVDNYIEAPATSNVVSLMTISSGENIHVKGNMFNLLKAAVAYSRAINVYAYGTMNPSANYFIENNYIVSNPGIANTRGINLTNDVCTGMIKATLSNNEILAAVKVYIASSVTNTNLTYGVDPITGMPYLSKLAPSVGLSDVITKVNDIIDGLVNHGAMLY